MDQTSAAVATGAAGTATLIVMLQDVSAAFLGVPLPVVLAAMTGAWFARSLAPAANFISALFRTMGWTIVGCVLAPLGQFSVKHFWSADLPTAALAGLALIISGGLPMVLPIIQQKLPDIVGSWLDRLKGTK